MTRNQLHHRTAALHLLLLLASYGALAGCSSVRLPRIDPTGASIFMPAPNSTTLVGPGEGPLASLANKHHAKSGCNLGLGCKSGCGLFNKSGCSLTPQPAFTPPVQPRTCKPTTCERLQVRSAEYLNNVLNNRPGKAGSLEASPSVVMAPVGGEVVLLAGVCGKDGYLVKSQPIEWTIAPESVGHFVEVGDTRHIRLGSLGSTPKKITSTYAVSTTSSHFQRITRGTPDEADDIRLKKGQGWVSVTSPIEGTSHITIMAPEAEMWDRRRRSAVIHWVDAQWSIARPVVARAGDPQVLVTKVTRNSSQTPATGWIVRYELLDGPPVNFAKGTYNADTGAVEGGALLDANAIDVPVDARGYAAVQVIEKNRGGQPGISRFNVRIIRPAETSGELPELQVGSDVTSVTWVGAGLQINVEGSKVANVGTPLEYRVRVTNIGQVVAKDAAITLNHPASINFVASSLSEARFGQRVEWRLGELAPGAVSEFTVQMDATVSQVADLSFTATATGVNPATALMQTQVYQKTLDVRLTPETVDAAIGQPVTFNIDVANLGSVPMAAVVLRDEFDVGLEEQATKRPEPVEQNLGDIQPGKSKSVAITFIPRRVGRLQHRLIVTTNNGQGQKQLRIGTVNVSQAATVAPKLDVRVSAPSPQQVGQQFTAQVEVKNVGDVATSQYQVVANYGGSLTPLQASDPRREALDRNQIIWNAPRELLPGQSQVFQIVFQANRPDEAALFAANVLFGNRQKAVNQMTLRIVAAGQGGAPAVSQPNAGGANLRDASPGTGNLDLRIVDFQNGVRVNTQVQYTLIVANNRNVDDSNVELTITIPRGMVNPQLNTLLRTEISPDGSTIRLEPIQSLRSGESQRITLRLTAQTPGPQRIRLQATSFLQRTGIETFAETNVQP